jgi:hypothetical protein
MEDVLNQDWWQAIVAQQCESARDVLNFSAVSKAMRAATALVQRESENRIPDDCWIGPAGTCSAVRWKELCFPPGVLFARLTCTWSDQGWGNRKGMLAVVRAHARAPDEHRPWSSEDMVASAGPAAHNPEDLSLQWRVEPGESYALWVRVGGGGGHRLVVENVRITELAYGAAAR